MKWWAQSFLVGVPKIICGFRDDDGVIHNLQTFRTVDIPRESQGDLDLWQGNICMNFLDDLLKWVKETVSKDDSQTVYIIEWKHPFTHVSATCHSVTPDLSVLPDWYIQKTSPSSDAS
jgi:RAT1-interacting protein